MDRLLRRKAPGVGAERAVHVLGEDGGEVAGARGRRVRRPHDQAAAQQSLEQAMQALGLNRTSLEELPKGSPEKLALAWWLRERTVVSLRWVGQALAMGHYTRVTQAVSRMKLKPARKLQALKRRLLKAEEKHA